MSVCAQTTEDESGSEEAEPTGPALPKLPQDKEFSKCVRVLIVIAYLISVSLAAILLSVYYVWIWKSPDLPPLNDTQELEALQGELHEYQGHDAPIPHIFDTTGGSNTTVRDVPTSPTPTNISLPALEPSDVTTVNVTDLTQDFDSTSATDLIELMAETTNYTETDT